LQKGKILFPTFIAAASTRNETDQMQGFEMGNDSQDIDYDDGNKVAKPLLKSVAGASAGAMASVLLAAGLNPRGNLEFASSLTINHFWDFPGYGGIIKGELLEEIMVERLKQSSLSANGFVKGSNDHDLGYDELRRVKLEDGLIPIAVSAFDILNLENVILTKGCMGKAARASASFPGLFQPCSWRDSNSSSILSSGQTSTKKSSSDCGMVEKYRYLVDGGLWDRYGLEGLGHLCLDEKNIRIVNLVAGSFGISGPPGPSRMPKAIRHNVKEVVSISVENTPKCGPWAMKNGAKAAEKAMNAIIEILDSPMYLGEEEGHYVLHVDAAGTGA
jgi:hypothetical protein